MTLCHNKGKHEGFFNRAQFGSSLGVDMRNPNLLGVRNST